MKVSQAKRLKALEKQNQRLKQAVADQAGALAIGTRLRTTPGNRA